MVFIDESGAGTIKQDKNSLWITAGVLSSLDAHGTLTRDFQEMKDNLMRNPSEELKGSIVSRHLLEGKTAADVAIGVSELMRRYDMGAWITGANRDYAQSDRGRFTPSNAKKGLQAKDIARELLLERISGYAGARAMEPRIYQLIWDLSDVGELIDYSAVTSAYKDPRSGKSVDPQIIPKILGALSHDWAELQIADVLSNFALNRIAEGRFPDADSEKSAAFKEHLCPLLVRSAGCTDPDSWGLLGL